MIESLEVDWSEALSKVLLTGRYRLAGALPDGLRLGLLSSDMVPMVWRQLDEQLPNGVHQQYKFASIDPRESRIVHDLCADISDGVRQCDQGDLGLDEFALNEASFHRYQPEDAGLSRHRDMHFYRLLIAGFTLEGTGELHLFDDLGTTTEVWETEPGDLYLFRAPGLAGNSDGRPVHATGPTTGRTSLTLRYNHHGRGGWDETSAEPDRL